MPTLPRHLAALLMLTAACGASTRDAEQAGATIDTLAGGIVRVTNHSPADSGKWSLVLERTVQPADDSAGALRDPADLILLDDGTLFVADEKPVEVMRFDPTGRYVGTVGREGGGPGEFRSAWLAYRGDTLVVHDPAAARAGTFLISTSAPLLQRPTTPRYFSRIGLDGSGRAVVPVMLPPDSTKPPRRGFIRFSLDGATLDTAFLPEHPKSDKRWLVREGSVVRMEMQVPMQPQDLSVADPIGGFVLGWSGEYLLRATRNGQDTTLLFSRPRPSGAISAAEKQAIVEDRITSNKQYTPEAVLRASLLPSAIPDERPAFEQIAVDRSGRRWVRLSSSDTTTVRFDLFDKDGRWLDVVSVAQSGWNRQWWQPVFWAKERVAVLIMDEEGRPAIKVYRIIQR
ncbi:MAG: hypothetical protein IPJ11_04810 [Gemmatimonadetes bacterium]|nr:hypothetical protein [Gemmatimonadota bacterium]